MLWSENIIGSWCLKFVKVNFMTPNVLSWWTFHVKLKECVLCSFCTEFCKCQAALSDSDRSFISLLIFYFFYGLLRSKRVAQLCPTLCNPLDCSPPGPSVHGILQARMLEWVAMPFSRGSSRPRDQTPVSCIAGRFFTIWATSPIVTGNRSTSHFSSFSFYFMHLEALLLCACTFRIFISFWWINLFIIM